MADFGSFQRLMLPGGHKASQARQVRAHRIGRGGQLFGWGIQAINPDGWKSEPLGSDSIPAGEGSEND